MGEIEWMRIVWWLANLSTGAAYFAIPYELWAWTRGIPWRGYRAGIFLFCAFIFFCGAHHTIMVVMDMPKRLHPIHEAQVFNDVAMATVSLLAAVFLAVHRSDIRRAIATVAKKQE